MKRSLLSMFRLLIRETFLVALLASSVSAQVDSLAGASSDELFVRARSHAFNGRREEARALLRIAVDKSPEYMDLHVLMGRTYAWDGIRDSARLWFNRALAVDRTYPDALTGLSDVELWDDHPAAALEVVNRGLPEHPQDEELLIRKAKALKALNRDDEALAVLNVLEDMHPSSTAAANLRSSILSDFQVNGVGVNYAFDRFADYYDLMQYVALQYNRRTNFGVVFGRINISDRFQNNGVQWETELYPRLTDGTYATLNYGYSASTLFPRHRVGLEVYRTFPWSLEGSLGFRYLWYSAGSSVTISTGTLGYYTGNFWISLRPYITSGGPGTSISSSMTVRRYVGGTGDYVSMRFGAGFSPDERTIQSNTGLIGTQLFYLKSQTVGVGTLTTIVPGHQFIGSLDYTRQELSFRPGEYVTLISLSAGWRWQF